MEELVNDLQFDAAALLIEIQDVSGVTQIVVEKVVSRVNQLFESLLGILHHKFESICGPYDALSQKEIFDTLNTCRGQNVFEGLDTREKLDNYMDQLLGLVKPDKVVLLKKEVTKQNSVQMKPLEWGYCIPFLPSLKMVLSCPEVLQCVRNPLPHTVGVYKTALDGAFYRNHPIVKEDPQTLGVGIYTDGAEVTDSASSKSGIHNLNFIYWTLYNIHPNRRSSIRSVFLLGVVKVSFLKKHGYNKILEDFIKGINQLSSTGIVFNINGAAEQFHGLFLTCSGDNPGSANIGRFKESSSFSNKPCRQCHVTQSDLYSSFKQSSFTLRSKNSHLAQVVEVETGGAATDENLQHPSVRHGVNGRSALMDIHGCDVTKCLPQDCMHDILEGTLKLDVCCILDHVLIQKKSMSVKELNNRIRMFSKSLRVNRPPAIDLKHVQKFKLKMTASEALNLAYILPFVLRKKNFISGKVESVCDEKNLEVLILRLNLMDLLLAEEITTADLVQIQNLTELHHALFKELYPDRMIPKMHYECHFSIHILLFGPPCQYWCSRFEAKHAFFKRRWGLYRSLKDHAGTLAWAHQRNQCGLMLLSQKGKSGPFLPTSDSCGRRYVIRPLRSLQHRNDIQGAFPGVLFDAAVPEFNVATVKGVVYHRKDALITAFNSEGPLFGKLVNILKVQDKLAFVFQKFQTISYKKDLNSFAVKHTRDFGVILASSLPYNHRLIFIQSVGACYITVPCRSYLNV